MAERMTTKAGSSLDHWFFVSVCNPRVVCFSLAVHVQKRKRTFVVRDVAIGTLGRYDKVDHLRQRRLKVHLREAEDALGVDEQLVGHSSLVLCSS